ncbi:RDD family protein [Corynebacterium sp.]|uniref:RDD family protein n=1 Tax=Corynebacterium sp. TaxID=1720 RepID=UPI0026DD9416|nr:RDD family protein [Corynebacterium sp.]MDO5031788.1 RDD family protein [Corynebacterium sp.]
MIKERIGITARRAVAWWIDGFLVAAVVVLAKWLINRAANEPLTGYTGDVYDIVALSVTFYLYRVIVEAKTGSSLGKWSLRLQVIPTNPAWVSAAVRNLWLLLPLFALLQLPFSVEGAVMLILGLSVLAVGQTPFDILAGCLVERKVPDQAPGPAGTA